METITEKLQLLNCPPDMYQVAYKHLPSLEMVSLSELESILRLLISKGIIVPESGKMLVEPADFTIFANGLETIQNRISEMDEVAHELDAYREKLIRINSKSAFSNLMAMKGMDEPYKTPEGKYSKVPFSIRRFQGKYGFLSKKDEVVPSEPTAIENTNIINVFNEQSSNEVGAEVAPMRNAFEDILSSPQEIGLNDEMFDRFERLSDSLRRIMLTVYGVEEVNDTITDNLIKLITAGAEDDDMVLYYAITYGKNISADETERIRDAIYDELRFLSGDNVELGRAA